MFIPPCYSYCLWNVVAVLINQVSYEKLCFWNQTLNECCHCEMLDANGSSCQTCTVAASGARRVEASSWIRPVRLALTEFRRLVAGFPPRRPGFKPGSGYVGFCDGQKWRWGRFSPRIFVSPANLHSIRFSTIIFTITRGWHNRPGVAAVPIVSQTK
jgi:hypothetical protein